jgi:hypothetical protein
MCFGSFVSPGARTGTFFFDEFACQLRKASGAPYGRVAGTYNSLGRRPWMPNDVTIEYCTV